MFKYLEYALRNMRRYICGPKLTTGNNRGLSLLLAKKATSNNTIRYAKIKQTHDWGPNDIDGDGGVENGFSSVAVTIVFLSSRTKSWVAIGIQKKRKWKETYDNRMEKEKEIGRKDGKKLHFISPAKKSLIKKICLYMLLNDKTVKHLPAHSVATAKLSNKMTNNTSEDWRGGDRIKERTKIERKKMMLLL